MFVSDPCGIRTQPLQLAPVSVGTWLATSPEVERAVLCAHRMHKVGREVLESSSADFQSAASPSQLPTQDWGRHRGQNEKKPDVEVTPAREVVSEYGLASFAQNVVGERRLVIETGRLIGITLRTQRFAYDT